MQITLEVLYQESVCLIRFLLSHTEISLVGEQKAKLRLKIKEREREKREHLKKVGK